MYFFAHSFLILSALPAETPEELIYPILLGTWSPDMAYFSLFSWQLRIFGNQPTPPLNFYQKGTRKAKAFILGWKAHIICDKLIHHQPFFNNKSPLCPETIKNQGFGKWLVSAKNHLGREIGLDLFIYKNLLKIDNKNALLFKKETFAKERIIYSGVNQVQKYVYLYMSKFLPMIASANILSKLLREFIDYSFYQNEAISKKTLHLLKRAQENSSKIFQQIKKEK